MRVADCSKINITLRKYGPRRNWSHASYKRLKTWWRHQMKTFSVLLALCAWNSPVTGEFPTQRPVTRTFGVFFALCYKLFLTLSICIGRKNLDNGKGSLCCVIAIYVYCLSKSYIKPQWNRKKYLRSPWNIEIYWKFHHYSPANTLMTRFMGPAWGPPGSCRPQIGPM